VCVCVAPYDHFPQLALVRHHTFHVINLLVSLIRFTLPSIFPDVYLTYGLKYLGKSLHSNARILFNVHIV
jgi:hypothetical protein